MTTPSFFITPGYGTRLHDALHYSQAMRIGDRVEISGQGGWIATTCPTALQSGRSWESKRWGFQPCVSKFA